MSDISIPKVSRVLAHYSFIGKNAPSATGPDGLVAVENFILKCLKEGIMLDDAIKLSLKEYPNVVIKFFKGDTTAFIEHYKNICSNKADTIIINGQKTTRKGLDIIA